MLEAFQMIAEERIKTALSKGEFEDLKGKGKPLSLDENPHVPEDSRMAFKILKNSGYVPEEISLNKEIRSLEQAIRHEHDASTKLR